MKINEIEKKIESCRCGKFKCRGECTPKPDKSCRCGKFKCQGECSGKINEIYKKKDYVKCPDGQRHDWQWGGSLGAEGKTNRATEGRKCGNCGLTKKVFADTGKRINR